MSIPTTMERTQVYFSRQSPSPPRQNGSKEHSKIPEIQLEIQHLLPLHYWNHHPEVEVKGS